MAVGGLVAAVGDGRAGDDVLVLDVARGREVGAGAGRQQSGGSLRQLGERGQDCSLFRAAFAIVSSTIEFSRAPLGQPA